MVIKGYSYTPQNPGIGASPFNIVSCLEHTFFAETTGDTVTLFLSSSTEWAL